MLSLPVISVAVIFSAFVFLDILSTLPRIAGSIVQKNGIAYSFQVIVNTVKRVFIVLYPPLLGLIAVTGSLKDLFITILFSYLLAALTCIVSVLLRSIFIRYFCEAIIRYSDGSSLLSALFGSIKSSGKWAGAVEKMTGSLSASTSKLEHVDRRIFFAALWIYFFYSASVFVINLLGFVFQEYSSIILQMTGFVNAIGTLALAFYLDPMLSRIYEASENIRTPLDSLILAHIINISLLSPALFGILYFWML